MSLPYSWPRERSRVCKPLPRCRTRETDLFEVFYDQDFADLPINEALEIGRYFGRLHIHPVTGAPAGYPEVHLVHRGANDIIGAELLSTRTNTVTWHADVTYEAQPPGTTFLYILDTPDQGGDTLFSSQVEAYNRLSPEFQKRLHGLSALHSGIFPKA